MTTPRICDLCQHRTAAPGIRACDPCDEHLIGTLRQIQREYAAMADDDELAPAPTRTDVATRHRAPGSRPPAGVNLFTHRDARTTWTPGGGYGTLAAISSWARNIREERDILPPLGPLTLERELGTIRYHWTWLLAQPWLLDFAEEIQDIARSLVPAGMRPKVWRIERCPANVGTYRAPEPCGAPLRVQTGQDVIHCGQCKTVWAKENWTQLGDPWTDYATLSEDLNVPVGTLWRWCHDDAWRTSGTRARRLVHRQDAIASYERRRAPAARCA